MSLDRINWSRFGVYKVTDSDLDGVEPIPLPFNDARIRIIGTGITEPGCQIVYEDFLPGDVIEWTFVHDEVQYAVSGHAEIEFWLPPLYQEKQSASLGPGSVYFLPQGGRMRIRVVGDAPFRHLCICYPNPAYPVPDARSVLAARAAGKRGARGARAGKPVTRGGKAPAGRKRGGGSR